MYRKRSLCLLLALPLLLTGCESGGKKGSDNAKNALTPSPIHDPAVMKALFEANAVDVSEFITFKQSVELKRKGVIENDKKSVKSIENADVNDQVIVIAEDDGDDDPNNNELALYNTVMDKVILKTNVTVGNSYRLRVKKAPYYETYVYMVYDQYDFDNYKIVDSLGHDIGKLDKSFNFDSFNDIYANHRVIDGKDEYFLSGSSDKQFRFNNEDPAGWVDVDDEYWKEVILKEAEGDPTFLPNFPKAGEQFIGRNFGLNLELLGGPEGHYLMMNDDNQVSVFHGCEVTVTYALPDLLIDESARSLMLIGTNLYFQNTFPIAPEELETKLFDVPYLYRCVEGSGEYHVIETRMIDLLTGVVTDNIDTDLIFPDGDGLELPYIKDAKGQFTLLETDSLYRRVNHRKVRCNNVLLDKNLKVVTDLEGVDLEAIVKTSSGYYDEIYHTLYNADAKVIAVADKYFPKADLFSFKDDIFDKYGLMDASGKVIEEPKYDFVFGNDTSEYVAFGYKPGQVYRIKGGAESKKEEPFNSEAYKLVIPLDGYYDTGLRMLVSDKKVEFFSLDNGFIEDASVNRKFDLTNDGYNLMGHQVGYTSQSSHGFQERAIQVVLNTSPDEDTGEREEYAFTFIVDSKELNCPKAKTFEIEFES